MVTIFHYLECDYRQVNKYFFQYFIPDNVIFYKSGTVDFKISPKQSAFNVLQWNPRIPVIYLR